MMREGSGAVDLAPVHQDATATRRLQPGDQTKQGGLAAAAGPEQCHELARAGEEVDRIEHRQRLSVQIESGWRTFDRSRDGARRGALGVRDYHRSRPFCHDSSRSRRRNSSVIRPLHISAITISAAYMLG